MGGVGVRGGAGRPGPDRRDLSGASMLAAFTPAQIPWHVQPRAPSGGRFHGARLREGLVVFSSPRWSRPSTS
ncbi:hypothetical protein ACRAWD_06430 [Caulobacter segnis]